MKFLCVLLATLFMACSFANGGVNVDPEFQHKVELDPAGAKVLSIGWRSGSIELIGDDRNSVRITAVGRKYGGLILPEEWLEFIEFSVDSSGKVVLEFVRPGVSNPYSIALQVFFPRMMAVEAETASGRASTNHPDAQVSNEYSSGEIMLKGTGPKLTLSTGSGSIEVNVQ